MPIPNIKNSLNPFKDADLEILLKFIKKIFSDNFGFIREFIQSEWSVFLKKAKERLTIMLIPHSEKRIINFHVPIYAITLIISAILIIITITSISVVNHASTIKDVSKLKMYGSNSKIQISKYKDEINKLYDIFQKFKPELTYLYSLTNEKDVDSLWAKGGVPNPNSDNSVPDHLSPSIEELNIKEIEHELKTSRDVLLKIKKFLNARKKIIENTPSLWPVEGYIISKFGYNSSSYKNINEFHSGIEISAFPGAEIRATAPGKVENIQWNSKLGLTAAIKHKYGFTTVYSNCQKILVEVDQEVAKGEIIGYVGRTGKTSKHLCYYQIKIGTEYVDPVPYLNKIPQ
ncbi:MAG: M23 family metallopeptidase [Spirochaetes bacterium]|nr:M23 family metallopeptidase [Spirochaetota bacterium]